MGYWIGVPIESFGPRANALYLSQQTVRAELCAYGLSMGWGRLESGYRSTQRVDFALDSESQSIYGGEDRAAR